VEPQVVVLAALVALGRLRLVAKVHRVLVALEALGAKVHRVLVAWEALELVGLVGAMGLISTYLYVPKYTT